MLKLKEEHSEVLGPDPRQAAAVLSETPHKLYDLRYTTAVIRESLRLHSIGQSFRLGSPDFQLQANGEQFPTDGFILQTAPRMTHRNPSIWPRPNEFLPDRFMVGEDHPLHPVKNALRTFEPGNTNCIGQELAMTELRLGLVFTLRDFEFDFNYKEWDILQ